MKLARRAGSATGRYGIVAMRESFHGRTIATVTATGQEKYQRGFGPLLPGSRTSRSATSAPCRAR